MATTTNASAADAALYAWKPKVNPWLIAATVALAAFMEVLDTSIANVALPYIAGEPGGECRSEHVGTDFVPGIQCDCLAHGRLGRERDRAEEFLHALHCDLHRQLLPVRHRAHAGSVAAISGISRGWRRRFAADGTGHHGRLIRAGEARSGFCTLWVGRSAGAFDRAHSGRVDHR